MNITALAAELERRSRIAALDAYLASLEAELGPVSRQEAAQARLWLDRVETPGAMSAAGGRRRHNASQQPA